ncbi:terpenoid synthase [Artomyces pyxidatus]|uniref:Terpenoid synthase n=1 Tax=Artomyces pyxidatus TaxID=48021 RepID=A0ACB8SQV6_9AGAM|nr:terpenoid synthase [Artomyces pyxidatus]
MLFFVFDDYTDQADGDGVQAYVDIVLDALENPSKPRGTIKSASPQSQRHFIESFTDYANAVIQEAIDRAHGHVRTIDSYLALSRLTAGPYPSFFPCELRLDLPDDVIHHPSIANMARLVVESIVLTNDVYSYNIEQSAGHGGHNIIKIVTRELGVNVDGAMDWVNRYHTEVLAQFLECRHKIPSFGNELDGQVEKYIQGLESWVRWIDCWSFESGRYFGGKGLEIQKLRVVELLPKVHGDASVTPMMVPSVALLS